MKKLNVEEYLQLLNDIEDTKIKYPEYREGQAAFNCLHITHPELTNSIRGTDTDPFYKDENLANFYKAILEE